MSRNLILEVKANQDFFWDLNFNLDFGFFLKILFEF